MNKNLSTCLSVEDMELQVFNYFERRELMSTIFLSLKKINKFFLFIKSCTGSVFGCHLHLKENEDNFMRNPKRIQKLTPQMVLGERMFWHTNMKMDRKSLTSSNQRAPLISRATRNKFGFSICNLWTGSLSLWCHWDPRISSLWQDLPWGPSLKVLN